MAQALAGAQGAVCLIAWCALIAACVGLYALVKYLQKPDRNVERGVLSDAKLITSTTEIRRRNDFWDGKDEPEGAGLVIGSSGRGYVYDSSVPHFAVVGKTGSGKSWLMVLQTLHLCMARGWNPIVTGKGYKKLVMLGRLIRLVGKCLPTSSLGVIYVSPRYITNIAL